MVGKAYLFTAILAIIALFSLFNVVECEVESIKKPEKAPLTRSPEELKQAIKEEKEFDPNADLDDDELDQSAATSAPKSKRKLTAEEAEKRAIEADKTIRFLSHAEFTSNVSKNSWLIFWGTRWCKYCKRLSPRWLKLQEKAEKFKKKYSFDLAKVDCTEDEKFCTEYGVNGYPTVIFYHNGQPVEEYTGEQKLKDLYRYAHDMAKKHASKRAEDEL